jgi:telomerase reverse transcriptase
VLPGLKVSACAWLHGNAADHGSTAHPPDSSGARAKRVSSEEHDQRRELLGRWVHWLFDGLVVPLLRAFFYATESSTHKNRVFYYRKPLWKDMQGEALVALRDAM